jgi:hypothetical protein
MPSSVECLGSPADWSPCVVPGSGLAADGSRWIACRPGFFLPVRVLSRLFRRLFLEYLEKAFNAGQLHFSASLDALHDRQAFAAYLGPSAQRAPTPHDPAGPSPIVCPAQRQSGRVSGVVWLPCSDAPRAEPPQRGVP